MRASQPDWQEGKMGAEVSSGQLSQLHSANCQHGAKSDLILRQWLWEVLDRGRASLGLSQVM